MNKSDKLKWKSLIEPKSDIPPVYELTRPIDVTLWCLYVSKHNFNREHLKVPEIHEIIIGPLSISIKLRELGLSFGSAVRYGKVIRQGDSYKISAKGEAYLRGLRKNGLFEVFYAKPGQAWDTFTSLEQAVKSIPSGEILVFDPYYGFGSLGVLGIFAKHHKIRFLTRELGGGEDKIAFSSMINAFQTQHGSRVQMRTTADKSGHDRYIIAQDRFLILGQGIKDLGVKESMIIVIQDKYGVDIRKTILSSFEARWKSANPL